MRLIFFGDSFTFGQGYPDCQMESEFPKHSRSNWPTIVAEELGVEYVNTSYFGSSNQEIFYKIRTFQIQPDDFFVIQWSYPDRDAIISKGTVQRIGYWKDDKINLQYFKAHTEQDTYRRGCMTIEHAALWLTYHKHDYIMLADNAYDSDVNLLILDNEMAHCVDQWPCKHPGHETNKIWAGRVLTHIKGYLGGTRVSIPKVAR